MGILIDKVRIANFRAIKNLEVNLSKLTMLVGANNAGKTSFLRALHLALGIDRRIVNREDVHDDDTVDVYQKEIIIDIRIIAVDDNGKRTQDFHEDWRESDGFSGNIKPDTADYQFLGIRTKYKFDNLNQTFKQESYTLKEWLPFDNWTVDTNEDKRFQKLDAIPLIFVDAQRDIQADLKDRSSFLGKMTNKPDIKPEDIAPIENQINALNEFIILKSDNLKILRDKLKELNKTVLSGVADGVEITAVSKKIRDIGRNLNINFNDSGTQSFPLEYHGMGTRSWASLLTLNAFIYWQEEINKKAYFPILALEEPEAHLHPNAQRQLYHQLAKIPGQKIISTHSPFVAAQCDLMDLRHFYKDSDGLKVGQLIENRPTEDFGKEVINDLNYFVIQNRGEILFSKAIVLIEGATEEQALPLLYFQKTGKYPYEHGINFVSVNGKNYFPFLVLSKFLNIKWFILSDGDNGAENEVKSQIDKIDNQQIYDKLFVFDNIDFEEYLVNNGYSTFIQKAINNFKGRAYFPNEFIEEFDQQKMKGGSIRNYKGDNDGGVKRALLDCMRKNKFDFAKSIANEICNHKNIDGKTIFPPKIDELFIKIAADLKIELP